MRYERPPLGAGTIICTVIGALFLMAGLASVPGTLLKFREEDVPVVLGRLCFDGVLCAIGVGLMMPLFLKQFRGQPDRRRQEYYDDRDW